MHLKFVEVKTFKFGWTLEKSLPPSAVAEAAAILLPATKFCESADSQFTVETNGFLKVEFRADSIMEANILV